MMEKPQKNRPGNDYVRYSSMAFEMIVMVLIAVFGGRALDNYLELNFKLFTLVFSVLAIALVIYKFIRLVSNDKK